MMNRLLIVASFFMLVTKSTNAQTFTWTTNDSVVENLALNSTVQFPLHQVAVGTDTITLGIEVIYNDLPATWDGMLCIYGTCLGNIPVVGTTAQMNPISGATEGMVRLTVNPLNGTEVAKLQVYVFDVNYPNDGDTATFILNTTLGTEEMNPLSESIKWYPNPVVSLLNFEANSQVNHIAIYDLTGKEVLNTQINISQTSINIASLKRGQYIAVVQDSDGNKATHKFVKE